MTRVREFNQDGRVEERFTDETHFEIDTLEPDDERPVKGRLEMEVAE